MLSVVCFFKKTFNLWKISSNMHMNIVTTNNTYSSKLFIIIPPNHSNQFIILLYLCKYLYNILLLFSTNFWHSISILLKLRHCSLAENFSSDIYFLYNTLAVFVKSLACSLHHFNSFISNCFFFLVSQPHTFVNQRPGFLLLLLII